MRTADLPPGLVAVSVVVDAIRERDYHYSSEGDRGRIYRHSSGKTVHVKKSATVSKRMATEVLKQAGYTEAEAAHILNPVVVAPGTESQPIATKTT